jgi:hypothetical protein
MNRLDEINGAFEIHIFVAPLHPTSDIVEKFRQACANSKPPMKSLLLHLDYVQRGFVPVMQSSRYVHGALHMAIAAARTDAQHLTDAGLLVLRQKVEAVATNDGVPVTTDAAAHFHAGYFEFHLLFDGVNRALEENDMASLRKVAHQFTQRFQSPVPLSFNAMKPSQRFLNFRARNIGRNEAQARVKEIELAVEAQPHIVLKKVIAEYVCFDTNVAVDNGWLEPLPIEK